MQKHTWALVKWREYLLLWPDTYKAENCCGLKMKWHIPSKAMELSLRGKMITLLLVLVIYNSKTTTFTLEALPGN
jgi:hypothetical protein